MRNWFSQSRDPVIRTRGLGLVVALIEQFLPLVIPVRHATLRVMIRTEILTALRILRAVLRRPLRGLEKHHVVAFHVHDFLFPFFATRDGADGCIPNFVSVHSLHSLKSSKPSASFTSS